MKNVLGKISKGLRDKGLVVVEGSTRTERSRILSEFVEKNGKEFKKHVYIKCKPKQPVYQIFSEISEGLIEKPVKALKVLILVDNAGINVAQYPPEEDLDIITGMTEAIKNFVEDTMRELKEKGGDITGLDMRRGQFHIELFEEKDFKILAMYYDELETDTRKRIKRAMRAVNEEYGEILRKMETKEMKETAGIADILKGVFEYSTEKRHRDMKEIREIATRIMFAVPHMRKDYLIVIDKAQNLDTLSLGMLVHVKQDDTLKSKIILGYNPIGKEDSRKADMIKELAEIGTRIQLKEPEKIGREVVGRDILGALRTVKLRKVIEKFERKGDKEKEVHSDYTRAAKHYAKAAEAIHIAILQGYDVEEKDVLRVHDKLFEAAMPPKLDEYLKEYGEKLLDIVDLFSWESEENKHRMEFKACTALATRHRDEKETVLEYGRRAIEAGKRIEKKDWDFLDDIGDIYYRVGWAYMASDDLEDAEKVLKDGVKALEDGKCIGDALANLYYLAGWVCVENEKYKDAIKLCEKAKKLAEDNKELYSKFISLLASLFLDRGDKYRYLGGNDHKARLEYNEVLRAAKDGMVLSKKIGNWRNVRFYHRFLAEAYMRLGDYETALKEIDKGEKVAEKHNMELEAPIDTYTNIIRGVISIREGDIFEADDHFEKALEIAGEKKERYELDVYTWKGIAMYSDPLTKDDSLKNFKKARKILAEKKGTKAWQYKECDIYVKKLEKEIRREGWTIN